MKNKLSGLKVLHNKKGLKVFEKLKGGFGLYRYSEIAEKSITIESKGFYSTLLEHLIDNGTYKVYLPCTHNKKDIAKYFEVGTRKLDKWIKELEDNELVKTIHDNRYTMDIIINPSYYRLGKYVHQEVLDMFSIVF